MIACMCGETDDLAGEATALGIRITCGFCGTSWMRGDGKRCDQCESDDLQTVPLAIIEKGRGTQLSVVGVRDVDLCSTCDQAKLRRYHDNRPNPLMPDELPTIAPGEEL